MNKIYFNLKLILTILFFIIIPFLFFIVLKILISNIIIILFILLIYYLIIFIFKNRILLSVREINKDKVWGYKLKNKFTIYFLLYSISITTTITVIILISFYFFQNFFIKNEEKIYGDIIANYTKIVDIEKKQFARAFYDSIINNPHNCEAIFTVDDDGNFVIIYEKSRSYYIFINRNIETILNYFKNDNDKENLFYFSKDNVIISKINGIYYIEKFPEYLRDAFIILDKDINKLRYYSYLKKIFVSFFLLLIAGAIIFIIVLSIIISRVMAMKISKNLEKILIGTNRLAKGDFDFKIEIKSNDELEDLAHNFNETALKLKLLSFQQKRIERYEAWNEMARRLAHEIKNPLTPIRLSAERLEYLFENKRENLESAIKKIVETIISEVKRMEDLLNQFSKFSRLPTPKFEKNDIIKTIESTIEFFKEAYSNYNFTFNKSQPSFILTYDENLIKQALINIIKNAIEAEEDTNNKNIEITFDDREEYIEISIKDYGKGIPMEIRNKIFTPYFTSKKEGTGIGLSIAEKCIIEHDGNLWFDSNENGTIFYIYLPVKNN